jgi:hypothetical protein
MALVEIEAVFEPHDNPNISQNYSPPRTIQIGMNDSSHNASLTMHTMQGSFVDDLSSRPAPSSPGGFPPRIPVPALSVEGDLSQADDYSVSMSIRSSLTKSRPIKPHLLRLKKHWTLASCCVCKSSITAKNSYHCEVCSIDCCADCNVQVDVQLPCGSDLATRARQAAIQNKLTFDSILNVVAPMDESVALQQKLAKVNEERVLETTQRMQGGDQALNGENRIGTMKLEFSQAVVFGSAVPGDSFDIADMLQTDAKLRTGDYYIRVSWTGSPTTRRTMTIQHTARPTFDSEEMLFNV